MRLLEQVRVEPGTTVTWEVPYLADGWGLPRKGHDVRVTVDEDGTIEVVRYVSGLEVER